MIFVIVGSQKFSFDRLLKEVDRLLSEKRINEEVIVQRGHCTHRSVLYKEKQFMEQEEFQQHLQNCRVVITHGGSGAIINALKKKKKVIAVPRLAMFNEHVDNHQTEITQRFKQLNYIETIMDIQELGTVLDTIETQAFDPFVSQTSTMIEHIAEFIEG